MENDEHFWPCSETSCEVVAVKQPGNIRAKILRALHTLLVTRGCIQREIAERPTLGMCLPNIYGCHTSTRDRRVSNV